MDETFPPVKASGNEDGRSKNSPYYLKTVGDKLTGPMKDILENYSGIPSDQVERHVYELRDRAWDVHPYPCIGVFSFLDLSTNQVPAYSKILEILKPNPNAPEDQALFLDLACCFGQDIRKLVRDGVPASAVYGTDIKREFLELGFELFKDKDKFPDPERQFFVADIFDADLPENASIWNEMMSKFTIVQIANFLHLFNYERQLQICCVITRLMATKPGAMVIGRQVGSTNPREVSRAFSAPELKRNSGTRYWHSPETFRQMWVEVGEKTGTKWDVDVDFIKLDEHNLKLLEEVKQMFPSADAERKQRQVNYLIFTVTRVE
ncbi:hypothetical protein DTO021D3_3854 [Paecilomyces variotii]|nr:hypothetical protein DTO032I3_7931 [Paecilomyces variotii]KAJ9279398.1 hypothetical protein DTO021D3_3854 [Paecilomyces variotii]KAJ9341243.1 hypothetical protein DTO027B6_6224 [Paecilomyces variotii]KAJ9349344.1 hypothetical protein DTO027B9_7618 [Paecilomyces variotii]KAJ9380566.1 hypothetical protein DTO032I4_6654 [Paecilomyces variotii]